MRKKLFFIFPHEAAHVFLRMFNRPGDILLQSGSLRVFRGVLSIKQIVRFKNK